MSDVRPLRRGYQLHLSLQALPHIWRRVTVPSDLDLERLHVVIQIAFAWHDIHKYQFECGGLSYSPAADARDAGSVDHEHPQRAIEHVRLCNLLRAPGDSCTYVYDYCDRWEHRVLLEAELDCDAALARPHVLDGACAAPPEDAGGALRFGEILKVLDDPAHREYDDLREWLQDYQPHKFDAQDALTLDLLLADAANAWTGK